MTQQPEDDILLRLTMPGKSLRIDPRDAPKMPEQKPVQQTLQSSPPTSSQPAVAPAPSPISTPVQPRPQHTYQPQRETNTIVPPSNTPPQSEEAQEDILRKLTMRPKQYEVVAPEMPKETSTTPKTFGTFTQTPEEARSNKPYVSSDNEVERIKKMAQNIIGSDMVQNRLKKK